MTPENRKKEICNPKPIVLDTDTWKMIDGSLGASNQNFDLIQDFELIQDVHGIISQLDSLIRNCSKIMENAFILRYQLKKQGLDG